MCSCQGTSGARAARADLPPQRTTRPVSGWRAWQNQDYIDDVETYRTNARALLFTSLATFAQRARDIDACAPKERYRVPFVPRSRRRHY